MKPAVIALLTAGVGATPLAAADGWSTDWDGTLYGYVNSMRVRPDSVLNPDNTVARLAAHSAVGELRLNLKAENETIRLTARPIVSLSRTHNGFDNRFDSDAWFSQWQLRVRAAQGWHVALGRDLLNWGPAQFRSPSSPFYFDNGRSDPMRELSGVDSLKVSWTPDRRISTSLVHVFSRTGPVGSGPNQRPADDWRDSWRNGWLLKFDQRGDAWAYGLVAARSPQQASFFGAHAQTTLSDAVLLYGEAGSSVRALPFGAKVARRTTALVGSSYTFENGQSLAVEYLHNGHSYTSAQEDAWFNRAETSPGRTLATQPPLLGRDYLHLVWQTNLTDNDGYWRAMYSHNLTDGSGEFAVWGDRPLNNHVTAYVLAVVPHGGARREFSALFTNSFTFGVKIALP